MNRSFRRRARARSLVLSNLALTGLSASVALAGGSGAQTVRSGHGISLDVGSKHVVGYFLADAKACHVTLLMGDRTIGDEVPDRTAARIRQTVAPNGVARIETAEGEALELACNAEASGLSVRVRTSVAAYTPAQ